MRKADYDVDYIKRKCKGYKLLLNREKDKDLISLLDSQGNVNGFMKQVLRQYMELKRTE